MPPIDVEDLSPEELCERYQWGETTKTRLNLVLSAAGSLSGTDGTSRTLTSKTDRVLLRAIREDANSVLVGAQTIRTEGWHLPATGVLIVISSGSLAQLPVCPDESRVIVTDLNDALKIASGRGRWVCEGGKDIAEKLIERDALDELCLSFVSGVDEARLPVWIVKKEQRSYQLVVAVRNENMLFTRWRRG